MSRTDLDTATLAKALRRIAGDGSVEWVMEPMQASVLLDVADALDENDRLRELVRDMLMSPQEYCEKHGIEYEGWASADDHIDARINEMGIEVDE